MISKDFSKKAGKRLRDCRKEKKITQDELAELSNYSVQHISMIENGRRNMSISAARSFSKILDVREEYLLLEDNIKTATDEKKVQWGNLMSFEHAAIDFFKPFNIFFNDVYLEDSSGKRVNIDFTPLFSEHQFLETGGFTVNGQTITPSQVGVHATVCGQDIELSLDDARILVKSLYEYAEFLSYKFTKTHTSKEPVSFLQEYFNN